MQVLQSQEVVEMLLQMKKIRRPGLYKGHTWSKKSIYNASETRFFIVVILCLIPGLSLRDIALHCLQILIQKSSESRIIANAVKCCKMQLLDVMSNNLIFVDKEYCKKVL